MNTQLLVRNALRRDGTARFARARKPATVVALAGVLASGAAVGAPVLLDYGTQARASYITDYTFSCFGPSCATPSGASIAGTTTPLVLDVKTDSTIASVHSTHVAQFDASHFNTGTSATFATVSSQAQTALSSTQKANRAYASISGPIATGMPFFDAGGNMIVPRPRIFTQGRSTWADDLLFSGAADGTPGSALLQFQFSGTRQAGSGYLLRICQDDAGDAIAFTTSSFCTGSPGERTLYELADNSAFAHDTPGAPGLGNFSQFVSVQYDFIYGTPTRLISDLQATMENAAGINDLFRSMDLLRIDVPVGTTLLAGSGAYNLREMGGGTVPLPGSLSLFFAALLAWGVQRRPVAADALSHTLRRRANPAAAAA